MDYEFRLLTHDDYEEVKEMCKDIWDGTDYMPLVFHDWVDDEKGEFFCIIDKAKNKIAGISKFSILPEHMGWLEGLRVHEEYRGQKLARRIQEYMSELANKYLEEGKVNKLGACTHLNNAASRKMLESSGFELEQQHMIVMKPYEENNAVITTKSFVVTRWKPTLEEFMNIDYFKSRDMIFHCDFTFMDVTEELYNILIKKDAFWEINGKKGIIYYKVETCFVAIDEDIDTIEIFSDYLYQKNKTGFTPYTTVNLKKPQLLENLKANGYITWSDWQMDYFYYLKK